MREFLARGRKSVRARRRIAMAHHAPHDCEWTIAHQRRSRRTCRDSRCGATAKSDDRVIGAASGESELSLLLVEPNVIDVHSDPGAVSCGSQVRSALLQACESLDRSNVSVISLDDERTAVILTIASARAAVAMAHNVADALAAPRRAGTN